MDLIVIFGQGMMEVNDRFLFMGGLCYINDEKDFDGMGLFGFVWIDSVDFDNFSYIIGVDYCIKDNVLGYVKYLIGFKLGGWLLDVFSGMVVFLLVEEEIFDLFEVGLKMEWNDLLCVNVVVFFNQYEGLQIGVIVFGLGFMCFNVDEIEIFGLEIEVVW